MFKRVLAAGIAVVSASATAFVVAGGSTAEAGRRIEPLVIAHRGASAHRPEHTLEAYRVAIAMGADYIEPDLVLTKDNVLVVRHENALSTTTDVAGRAEFADRKMTKTIDGVKVTDWFTEDLTFAELRTLKAKERIAELRPDNQVFDGQEQIPSFEEVIELAQEHGVGIYPETKHPTYFASIGLPFNEPLLAALGKHELTKRNSKVFVQSFEPTILQQLRPRTKVKLVQLISASGRPYDWTAAADPRDYSTLATKDGLNWLSTFVDGIGPDTRRIIPLDATGKTTAPTTLVKDAHRAGLVVHPWTFRPENNFLPADFRRGNPAAPAFLRAQGDATAWLTKLLDQDIDGIFADDPALATAITTNLT